MKVSVTILGEFDRTRPARAMIATALEHSASSLGIDLVSNWLPNVRVEEKAIHHADGVFVAPGAPSEEFDGILRAIQLARTERIPCLGTCGGFQRIVMEYALHVLKFDGIEHEEISPEALEPFFSRLKRSLVGKMAEVLLEPGSVVAECYEGSRTMERFACSYGLNRKYVDQLSHGGLSISGVDTDGEPRAVELVNHPFFLGTLFVPQVRSSETEPHPIITAFVAAAVRNAQQKTKPLNKAPPPTPGSLTPRPPEWVTPVIKSKSEGSARRWAKHPR